MKIMLIGGSGLVGSYLAPALEEQGHEVVIVDKRTLLLNHRPAGIEFTGVHVQENLKSDQDAEFLMDKLKPDAVIFLASNAPDAESSFDSAALTMQTFHPFTAAYYAADRHKVKKFIYLSGIVRQGSGPLAPLEILHDVVEHFLSSVQQTEMGVVVLKPTTIYAPGTVGIRRNMLNAMIASALEGRKLKLRPNDRADYVYIGDVVSAITGSLTLEQTTWAGTFYVSSGSPSISNRALVDLFNEVARECHFPTLAIEVSPDRFNTDMAYEESDTSRLILMTGIDERPLDLETGLHKLITYQQLVSQSSW